jgi:hypothetical protein
MLAVVRDCNESYILCMRIHVWLCIRLSVCSDGTHSQLRSSNVHCCCPAVGCKHTDTDCQSFCCLAMPRLKNCALVHTTLSEWYCWHFLPNQLVSSFTRLCLAVADSWVWFGKVINLVAALTQMIF